jgi:hypothetical protein
MRGRGTDPRRSRWASLDALSRRTPRLRAALVRLVERHPASAERVRAWLVRAGSQPLPAGHDIAGRRRATAVHSLAEAARSRRMAR